MRFREDEGAMTGVGWEEGPNTGIGRDEGYRVVDRISRGFWSGRIVYTPASITDWISAVS